MYSPPRSPLYEQFLNLDKLDTVLDGFQNDEPPTPVISPVNSIVDTTYNTNSETNTYKHVLRQWGLSDEDIDRARRWDQTPSHQSAESIHMKLLAECVESLYDRPPTLPLLLGECENRMEMYHRRRHTGNDYVAARARMQECADRLVSRKLQDGASSEEVAALLEATNMGQATMDIIAAHFKSELQKLVLKNNKPQNPDRTRPLRRSMRIRKMNLRAGKGATRINTT